MPCLPLPVLPENTTTGRQPLEGQLWYDPLRSSHRPRSQLCPGASGPVRDPAATVRHAQRPTYRPSPFDLPGALAAELELRALAPCGAPSGPVPHLSAWPVLRRSPADAPPRLFPEKPQGRPCSLPSTRPGKRRTRLPLGLPPKPSVVSSLPVGTVPGAFTAWPARGVTPDPDRRLLTRRESAVPPPVRRRGIQPVRGLHEWA